MSCRRVLSGLVHLGRQATRGQPAQNLGGYIRRGTCSFSSVLFCCSIRRFATPRETTGTQEAHISVDEARRLLSTVQVEDNNKQQRPTRPDSMLFDDFLELCKQMGMASSDVEARQLANSLDESGVVLIFRNRVFLRPNQVAQALAKVIPIALAPADDPRRDELARMEKEKAVIDRMAERQVRAFHWTCLTAVTLITSAIFRLTFWELSWDVMEPITYFLAYSNLFAGFLFFMVTFKDPSFQDFTKSFRRVRQEKLMKKRNFDIQRYKELQMQCYPGWKTHPRTLEG